MPPHAHGGGDEEEEVIIVRTDGPPFVDLKAKQGKGFEVDYDKVCKYIGSGKLSLADFMRDVELVNKAYIPTAHRSGIYLQVGSVGMLAAFTIFIIMGIVGGTPEIRSVIIPICLALFVIGLTSFMYSKWIEQPGIKEGAALVKKLLDERINPNYVDHPYRIRWTVRVLMKKKSTMHLGQTFVERPIISIYALRSPNDAGILTDWVLPDAFTSKLFVDVSEQEDEEHH